MRELPPSVVVVGVGQQARSAILATDQKLTYFDDLRVVLTTAPTDAVLILGADEFGSHPDDVVAVCAARARSVEVLTAQPIPLSAFELERCWSSDETVASVELGADDRGTELAGSDEGVIPRATSRAHALAWIRTVGLPSRSESFVAASEFLAAFGAARSGRVATFGALGHPPLGTGLVSSFDLLFAAIGGTGEEISWIDAHLRGPVSVGRGPTALSSSSVTGSLSALVRWEADRAFLLEASDAAARVGFEVTLRGPHGRVEISESGAAWHAPDGSLRASARVEQRTPPQALAAEVGALLLRTKPDPGPMLIARSLLAAQTALLSAHTGRPESPATVRGLARAM